MPLVERKGYKRWHLKCADKLDELFEKLMAELKATKLDRLYMWSITTKVGELQLSCCGDWIATCFSVPDAARNLGLDCNSFSGKWNFHPNWDVIEDPKKADDPQEFFESFERRLRAIL